MLVGSPTHSLTHNDAVSKVNGLSGPITQSAVLPVPVVSCAVHANTSAPTRLNLMWPLVVSKGTIVNGANGVIAVHHVKEDHNTDNAVTHVTLVWNWTRVTVATSVTGSTGPCGLPVRHHA